MLFHSTVKQIDTMSSYQKAPYYITDKADDTATNHNMSRSTQEQFRPHYLELVNLSVNKQHSKNPKLGTALWHIKCPLRTNTTLQYTDQINSSVQFSNISLTYSLQYPLVHYFTVCMGRCFQPTNFSHDDSGI